MSEENPAKIPRKSGEDMEQDPRAEHSPDEVPPPPIEVDDPDREATLTKLDHSYPSTSAEPPVVYEIKWVSEYGYSPGITTHGDASPIRLETDDGTEESRPLSIVSLPDQPALAVEKGASAIVAELKKTTAPATAASVRPEKPTIAIIYGKSQKHAIGGNPFKSSKNISFQTPDVRFRAIRTAAQHDTWHSSVELLSGSGGGCYIPIPGPDGRPIKVCDNCAPNIDNTLLFGVDENMFRLHIGAMFRRYHALLFGEACFYCSFVCVE